MIEFDLQKSTKSIHLEDNVKKSFDKKLVYFYFHRNDNKRFFIKVAIFDFQKWQIDYYESHTIGNLEKFNESQLPNIVYNIHMPHSFVDAGNGFYYCFVEWQVKETSHFYKIDIIRMKFYFCDIRDLYPTLDFEQWCFSPTPEHFQEDKFFYQLFMSYDKNGNITKNILRLSLNWLNNQLIHSNPHVLKDKYWLSPHSVKKIGNYLLSSKFLNFDFVICKWIEITFDKINDFYHYTNKYFKRYKYFRKFIFNEKTLSKEKIMHLFDVLFKDIVSQNQKKLLLKYYLQKKEIDFLTFVNSNNLKPRFNNWIIEVFDLETSITTLLETSISNPAHLEIDYLDNSIYVSSHAFFRNKELYVGGICFFWPGCIDKFNFIDWKIIKTGTFQHSTWFRYTSHVIFYYNGRKIISTIWEPNRLFFIDGITMELIYYYDLVFKNYYKEYDIEYNIEYINSTYLNWFEDHFIWFSISEKNGIIFIKWKTNNLLFDYKKKTILYNWNNSDLGLSNDDIDGTTHIFKIK